MKGLCGVRTGSAAEECNIGIRMENLGCRSFIKFTAINLRMRHNLEGQSKATTTRRCWASSALCEDIDNFDSMDAFVTTE